MYINISPASIKPFLRFVFFTDLCKKYQICKNHNTEMTVFLNANDFSLSVFKKNATK